MSRCERVRGCGGVLPFIGDEHVWDRGASATIVKRLQNVGVVATFGVARLTLQTGKFWLVGVATDRDASVTLACVSFF